MLEGEGGRGLGLECEWMGRCWREKEGRKRERECEGV